MKLNNLMRNSLTTSSSKQSKPTRFSHLLVTSLILLSGCVTAQASVAAQAVLGAAAMPITTNTAAGARVADQRVTDSQLAQFWQTVQTGTLTSQDGLQLAYAISVPQSPKGAILLVQGRTEAYLKYQELYFQLYAAGYAVFSMDHRGQGLSARLLADSQIGHVGHFADYQRDQLQFIHQVVQPQLASLEQQLASLKQRVPLFLLAHSMGGAVSAQLLAAEPTLFKAAVLSSPMMAPNASIGISERDGCVLESAIGWACEDCYAGFASQPYHEQLFSDNILTRDEARYKRFRQVYRQTPALQLGGPSWQWLGQACEVSEQMPTLAGSIKTQILMLQSGDEKAVSNQAQQEFCRDLGQYCTHQQVVRFDGALHELLFERDEIRNQALQQILQFYQQYQ